MLHISERLIEVCKIQNESDYQFVEQCLDADDFKLYIGKENLIIDDYFILKYHDRNLGCAVIENEDEFGVSALKISVYVRKDSRIFSTQCIISCIAYGIALYPNYERIEFRVFSNNYRCNKLFSQMGIEKECTYDTGKIINGEKIFLNYYSISSDEELNSIKKKILEFFNIRGNDHV